MLREKLKRRLHARVERNAVQGYCNAALPNPEVFERPGWRDRILPTGIREVVYEVLEHPPLLCGPRRTRVTVHPLVTVRDLQGTTFGLGVCVEEREYLFFTWHKGLSA